MNDNVVILKVYIQTVADTLPFCYRTREIEFSNYGINFVGIDTNCSYLFDFADVLKIIPDYL